MIIIEPNLPPAPFMGGTYRTPEGELCKFDGSTGAVENAHGRNENGEDFLDITKMHTTYDFVFSHGKLTKDKDFVHTLTLERIDFFVNPARLTDVRTTEDEIDEFFSQGHPPMSLPCFKDGYIDDAYLIFMDWPSEPRGLNWGEVIDQNGGEFIEYSVDSQGLVTAKYELFDHEYAKKGAFKRFTFTVTGYIATAEAMLPEYANGQPYFQIQSISFA